MANIENPKLMPDREKYKRASGMVRLYQKHVLAFVEQHLGYAAVHELSSIWRAAMVPMQETDPDDQKYEAAYNNWLWMARYSHDFLADLLNRDDVAEYKRLLLQLYKRQQDNPDLAIFRMFGNHGALASEWAYEMQWLTPIELADKSVIQMSFVVKNCRILQIPASERVCRVDCRSVGTALARRVYNLKRVTTPVDHGCTITLSPLDD